MDDINRRFDEAIQGVVDPHKTEREMSALRADPLFAASFRAMDRMKWDIASGVNPLER